MPLRRQKDTNMQKIVEYKVRPITRYVVTRFESSVDGHAECGQSTQCGVYDSEGVAHEVGYALCRAEHDRSGLPSDSMQFIYPQKPI